MKVTKFWLGKEVVKDNTTAGFAGNILKLLQEVVSLNTTRTDVKQIAHSFLK